MSTGLFVDDPGFYLTAIPAVLLYGIGKGGLGGALGVIVVPLMALTTPVTQAAAVLLPLLLVMDGFAVVQYRRRADYALLRTMLPGAVTGVTIAGLFMARVPRVEFSVIVGILCVSFSLKYYLGFVRSGALNRKPSSAKTWFFSILSGFSSTTIHAGGGPASMYLLPLGLDKVTLVATMAVFFAAVNVIKLVPFFWVGQLDRSNLVTSLVLMPLVPIGVWSGVFLLHRVDQVVIYRICYAGLLVSGGYLILNGWLKG